MINQNIEFTNNLLGNRLTCEEAKVYMFLLGDGWRFPTDEELYAKFGNERNYDVYVSTWTIELIDGAAIPPRYVIPVRDIDK